MSKGLPTTRLTSPSAREISRLGFDQYVHALPSRAVTSNVSANTASRRAPARNASTAETIARVGTRSQRS